MKPALKTLMGQINKKYKENIVLTPDSDIFDVHKVPSGVLAVDVAFGGGIPLGRHIELRGGTSVGKTSLALKIAGAWQRQDRLTHEVIQNWDAQLMKPIGPKGKGDPKVVVYIDAEASYDKRHAETLGVNSDELVLVDTNRGARCLDIVLALMTSDEVDLIIIDSIATLTSDEAIDKSMEERSRSQTATLLTDFFQKYLDVAHDMRMRGKVPPTVLSLNQIRDSQNMYAPGPTSPGGNALKHVNAIKAYISVISKGTINDAAETQVGQTCNLKVEKNKSGGPRMSVEYTLCSRNYYDEGRLIVAAGGTDTTQQILNLAKKFEYPQITTKGAWIYLGDLSFQGSKAFTNHLLDNPNVKNELENGLRKFIAERE